MVLNSITDFSPSTKMWVTGVFPTSCRCLGGVPGETGEPSGGAAGFQRLCYTLMTTVCNNNEARLARSFRFHTNVGLISLPQTESITSEEFPPS